MVAGQLKRLQIIEQLRVLASKQSTGTFFIKTPDKHLAVFTFKEGRIISLIYAHLRGIKALPEIARINSGECSYKSLVLGRPQAELPTTLEIIHQLETNASEATETTPVIDETVQSSIQTSAESTNPVQANNSITQKPTKVISEEELLSGIADILLDHIGPIAAMICDSAASDLGGISSLSEAQSLVDNLSSDIGETDQQKKFISDASAFIEKFFS